MPLQQLPVWQQLLSGEPDTYGRIANSVAAQLAPQDVEEFIRLAEHGTEKEKQAVVSVLLAMRGRLKEKHILGTEQRERLKEIALRSTRESFPLEPGYSFLWILSALDPSAGDDFLTEEVELASDSKDAQIDRILSIFSQFRKSLGRLRVLAQREDHLGERARYYLTLADHPDLAELGRLGEEFRQNHTASAMNRIYSSYISHQVNRPIAPILSLLGTPAVSGTRGGKPYIYEAEGVQLYMEEDISGNLSGLRIK